MISLLTISGFYWFRAGRKDMSPSADRSNQETVRLAVTPALITTPVLLARHLNYFSEEGLNVIVMEAFSSGKGTFEAMLAGNADISTPATTPVVFNSFKRQDYSIFATYLTTYEGVKIIARTDRGINSAADLKNRRIGIVRGTISEILLDAFLTYNKILLSEVEPFPLPGDALPEAISSGQVDAIVIWEPHANNALSKLSGIGIQIPSSKIYRIAINMAVMNDFAEKHPTILEKLVRALIRATDFINHHDQEAQKLMAKILEMDPKQVADGWGDITFAVSLDQLLLTTMENEAKWAIDHQSLGTPKAPNYLDYINYQALERVNPELVTIIRAGK